jgi:uncharacterized membrane protein YbhN (UPF0104 family)
LFVAVLALAAIGVLVGIAHELPIGTSELTDNVASWITHHVPRGLGYLFVSVVGLGCLALAVVAAVVLLRSDVREARNALVAFGVAVAIAAVCVVEWKGRRGAIAAAMLHGHNATILVVSVGFTAFLTGTDLARRPRWTRWCVLAVGLLPLSELSLNDLTVFALFAMPLGGWAVGLLVRWLLAVASVRPDPAVLQRWLRQSGVPMATLADAGAHGGLDGTLEDGTGVLVLLANRDTRGSGALRRLWRALRLRGVQGGSGVFSSRTQLQQQALASYTAASVGVLAPRVLLLAELPPETLVLALGRPPGAPPDERVSEQQLVGLFAALRCLHTAGIAHRDLRRENLVVGAAGSGFASMERALNGAGDLARRLDVAQGLTTSAGLVGAAEAVEAFRKGYRPDDEQEVAAILQPIALAPWGWSAMRNAQSCLTEVRREFVGPEDTTAPLRLERFRWRTVVSTVGLTVAGFVLVGQLSKVNLLGAFETMRPGWFVVAVVGSALTYLGAALNLAAFVPKRLSMVRGYWVQLSSAFVGVAMPPTVGHVAVNSRYLYRQGVEEGAIAAAVAVSQIVNVATTVPLLLIIGVLTGSGVSRFKLVPGPDLLIGLGSIVVVVGLLVAIPPSRALLGARIWPRVRTAIPRLLEAISQPVRLAVGAGGNLLLTSGYVLALYSALAAVGAHPPLLATAAVYLAGNTVGSIAPTPGGLGAVEAVLSAGLTAIGIPAHEAVPAVLLFRVATFWLPIPAGWVSFEFLQRSGTL